MDTAIIELTSLIEKKSHPTYVSTQQDINTLIDALSEYVKSKRLWQFYVLDVAAEKAALTNAFSSNTAIPWIGEDVSGKTEVQLAEIVRSSGLIQGLGTFASRYVAQVDGRISVGLIKAAYGNLVNDIATLAQTWARVVDILNAPLYEEWEDDTRAALSNIKGRLKYLHLEDHGPKVGKVSKECVTNSLTAINSTCSLQVSMG